MKKKILIISGGISKERLISLDTGRQVAKELRKNKYSVKISEPNFELTKALAEFLFDSEDHLIRIDMYKTKS